MEQFFYLFILSQATGLDLLPVSLLLLAFLTVPDIHSVAGIVSRLPLLAVLTNIAAIIDIPAVVGIPPADIRDVSDALPLLMFLVLLLFPESLLILVCCGGYFLLPNRE
jgi:hypothetical protein